ncbi:hypothetical protein [Streptomyces leeuwenhoekii]|uniref:hypothetical protein n=1 Tax=Streptomyces leeuwenhoekii TaxID=1437453 RepID=UPI0012FF1048|nr:hypothetical protein [Streptomyces leeuwenhoekii]
MAATACSRARDGMAAAIARDRVKSALRALGRGLRDPRRTATDLDTVQINRKSPSRR